MIDVNCQKCIKRFTCVGMQYNVYSHTYVCPHNMIKVVTDNKTTMLKDAYVGNRMTEPYEASK